MAKIRTAVIDDNPQFLAALWNFAAESERLEPLVRAASADEAIERMRTEPVDLVLSDIVMPGLNGLEATKLIKQMPAPPKIILVSLHSREVMATLAREAGADGFLSKKDIETGLEPLIDALFGAE